MFLEHGGDGGGGGGFPLPAEGTRVISSRVTTRCALRRAHEWKEL